MQASDAPEAAPPQEPKPDPPKPALLTPTAPADGFGFKSDDGAFALKIRGVVQANGRFFLAGGPNSFLVRKARPTLDGTVYRYYDFRITAELVSSPSVLDVYGNVRIVKEVQLRAGKFKSPLGLERLQSDPDVPFLERGLPTDLAPDRDVGAMLHGDILDGAFTYALGIFNGAPDRGSVDVDNGDKKDVAGRVFLHPLAPLNIDALMGFLGCTDEVDEDAIPKADAALDQKSDALSDGHPYATEAAVSGDGAVASDAAVATDAIVAADAAVASDTLAE